MLRPTAINVKPLKDFVLLLTFDNGECKLFDVKPLFARKPFERLNDQILFSKVITNSISVEWPDGIDICPDEIYYNSIPFKETA